MLDFRDWVSESLDIKRELLPRNIKRHVVTRFPWSLVVSLVQLHLLRNWLVGLSLRSPWLCSCCRYWCYDNKDDDDYCLC